MQVIWEMLTNNLGHFFGEFTLDKEVIVENQIIAIGFPILTGG